MKYLPLLVAALLRRKARTLLTMLSVTAAFALFGMLDAVRVAFEAPESLIGIDRLIVASRFSIIQPLPLGYLSRIQSVPGVKAITYANWFGGVYQDPKNFFPNFAVDADTYLAMYPELVLPPAERKAFLDTRTGAIVGQALAEQFGWKVGDKIPLQATIFPRKDGSNAWTFDLVGIYGVSDPALRGLERQMLFRWDYFDEGRDPRYRPGTVGWYAVRIDDPTHASRVAGAIDRQFANSADETKTQSERDFQRSFAKQVGDIGLIVTGIMGAVFFTLLLMTGNAMSQSIRERIPELAVLKTIGFSDLAVVGLVLAESGALLVLGGVAGMALAWSTLPAVRDLSAGQLDVTMQPQSWELGLCLIFLIALAVGLPPALKAKRISIVDALAGH
ncbi:MAG: ABC transporter permease [Chromatiaceae bacterium]